MKTIRVLALAVLIVGGGSASNVAHAQQPGVTRTDLLRHDLSVSGREVIQVRVDFAPGVAFPPHSHPGEEIAYVIEGSLEYELEGQPPGDAQRRRHPVHPGRDDPLGQECRHRQRRGARHVSRRKRQAARRLRSGERLGEVAGVWRERRRRERRLL